MNNARSALMTLLGAMTALLIVSCATPEAGKAPAGGPGAAAAEACIAAIPKDATAGQRSLAEQTCQRDAAAREAVVQAGTAAATSAAASGTSGDSLAACMARIPKDASAGQRMLAEGICKRDEAARQTTQR